MKNLEDVMWLIKENPSKYIGGKNLENLFSFIHGYIKCQYIKNGTYPVWLAEFIEYLQKKYNIKMSIDVPTIFRQISLSDDNAFDIFYEDLGDFLTPERLITYELYERHIKRNEN